MLEIARTDWDECRSYFPREAVMWADALRIVAFGDASGGESCGHNAGFELPVELLLEMPGPIRQARALLTRPDESVSSIARLLGISRTTLYKYLPELTKA
ncbi:helix-turn-helix domain-containing protein [Nocardia carnea]|uniref:helix-turn-helix domain-containing protein n=1 Tax=Nocardia carnea TaxID=37328 RepID=UPI002458EF51|nr:helix-turn-helix domain-containing protein [Nocardia carnea]